MTEAFKQGYMDKMAELRKSAESSLGNEYAADIVESMGPWSWVTAPANLVGGLVGLGSGRDLSDKEIEERLSKTTPGSSWIPGVAGYRLGLRTGVTDQAVRDKAKELGVKRVRPNWNNTLETAWSPADILTLGLGRAGGLLTSALTDHRSLEDQVKHDENVHFWKNLLVPGYGAYNHGKRLGVSRDLLDVKPKSSDDEDDENKKNKKNKTDKED